MLSTQVGKSKKSLKFQMSINRTKITKIFLNNNINIKGNFQVFITVSINGVIHFESLYKDQSSKAII